MIRHRNQNNYNYSHDCTNYDDEEEATLKSLLRINYATTMALRRRQKINHVTILYLVVFTSAIYTVVIRPHDWLPCHDDDYRMEFIEKDWKDFVKDYHHRFHHREPPEGMKGWLHFARENECEARRFYDNADKDLEYFRQQNNWIGKLLEWDQLIPQSQQDTDNYMAFELENNELKRVAFAGPNWKRGIIERLIRLMIKPVIEHQPPLKLKLFFNLHDGHKYHRGEIKYPFFSACRLGYITENQPPPTYHELKKLLLSHFDPGFEHQQQSVRPIPEAPYKTGDPQLDESHDLPMPYLHNFEPQRTNLWFWPFYNDGPDFRDRNDRITWRGSTTGAWGTGHRFQLVGRFSSKGIQPLENNVTKSGVDADFAFVRQVQTPNGETVAPNIRFAKHMFFRQMQQSKYIMDVDGNGTYIMKKALCSMLGGTHVFLSVWILIDVFICFLFERFYPTFCGIATIRISRLQIHTIS